MTVSRNASRTRSLFSAGFPSRKNYAEVDIISREDDGIGVRKRAILISAYICENNQWYWHRRSIALVRLTLV